MSTPASRRTTSGGITAQARAVVVGMVLLVAVAGLTGLVGVTIATSTVDQVTEELVPLADANHAVLQGMTDAETGLRGWVATGDDTFLEPYRDAHTEVIRDQLVIQQYAELHPELLPLVRRQDAAVESWFASYAEPRLDLPAGPGNVSHQRLLVGKAKFDRVRAANEAVASRLEEDIDQARARARSELPWVVVVLVLVAVLGAAAALLARVATGRITKPLVDMERTVDRLAAGDTRARTEVAGPREVRRVGEALNNFADQNARLLVLEREAVERLENLDKAKSEFVSNVSHELRTPLTSISGYVELFEDGFLDTLTAEQKGMLRVVSRNVERLQALIEDMLTLSQVEGQTFRTSFGVLDLGQLVRDAAQDVRATAATREVTVREEVPDERLVMRGDASQLSRAVLNLVSNAVKFSHPAGEVVVSVHRVDGRGVVSVRDEGIGIPARDVAHLGTRFFRASNAVDAEIKGTGLGLRIVRSIVENHGGRFEIESVEGKGTTARMRLPLEPGSESPGPEEITPTRR